MLTRVMYGDFTFDLTDHFSSDIVDPSPLSPRIASSSPSSILISRSLPLWGHLTQMQWELILVFMAFAKQLGIFKIRKGQGFQASAVLKLLW
ncbi:hypothetical protein CEXT_468441 [Caerostris extrusa]|uniref:Uncharacterized protein n=1 Tax=Caerostris extrusa TaxID=172846 RepID=A0AAV4T3E6_CAEEX|nr:hypothetical protein CEXT_468441 [Caerostris extrusa]